MKQNILRATHKQVSSITVNVVFLMISFVFGVVEAYALNDVTVRLYDQREIIASNYTALCQDREGFLWIGSETGLNRFDGNKCDLYRNSELDEGSISDNKIVSLYCDRNGNVWVGTVNGLNYYDSCSDSFRLVSLPGQSLNGFITDITELPDGKLAFLVAGIGIYTLDAQSISEGKNGIKGSRFRFGFNNDNEISRIAGLGDKGTVFSTRSGEVFLLSKDGVVKRLAKINGNVTNLCVENSNSLVIATQYEAFRVDLKDSSIVPLVFDGNEIIKIKGIYSDGNTTYFATASDGVWSVMADENNIRRAQSLQSSTMDLSSLKVGCIYIDRAGNLWFGCGHKGLAVASSQRSPFLKKSLGEILRKEGGAEVTCMTVSGNEIVIGLNNGIVLFLNTDGTVRKLNILQGTPVTSLCAYSGGRVLVGIAREGIWSVDQSSLAITRMIKPDKPYPGVVLTVGGKGEIIAAFGELGILRYDPASKDEKWFYPVAGSNLLSCFYYSGITAASGGRVWIGGYSGISCFDSAADGLIPIDQTPFFKGVVNDICECPGGVMIATDKGLLQYSDERGVIRKYTMLDGLPDNDVRTLTRDAREGIWIGTMKGLAYFKNSEGKIRTFGGDPGLKRTEYLFSDVMPSGKIAMGNFESLTVFNPDSVSQPSFGGNVKVTALYLNGKRIVSDRTSGLLPTIEGSPSCPGMVLLDHKDNALVVRLSTMDFRDPSDIRYEWQVDGEGEMWHSTSTGESLIYLPPLGSGKHVLRIRGWENDVSSDVTELKINVKAPWYLSNMAYVGYLVLLMMMGSLIYKVVKNKREEEMYEARIRYFMDISHELRSPVTLMISPVETLLKQEHSPEVKSQLLTVRRNAQRVLNLVDQLLDLRKIEKGKMKLVFSSVNIRAFVEELIEMFRPMAEDKGLTISFVCEFNDLWVQADRNNLDKILVNLISNAIKYTPKGGEVNVELRRNFDQIGAPRYEVIVTDTGIGLDKKVISHLFERFYQDREHHHGNISGFGIGLDLCMRLVQLHKGDLTARNREDGVSGSIFSVSLPLYPAIPGSVADELDPNRIPLPDRAYGHDDNFRNSKSSYRFRIMVVDDDEELREYIRRNLGASYKVSAHASGEEALKELRERLPDLIVTDIRMKGIDGFELLRRVKANMSTQHIPVILFSSANGADERTKGWKYGADGYLAKPFTIGELEGMISGLLDTRSKLKGKFSGKQESVETIETPKVKGVDDELMDRVNRYINNNISETAMNVDSLSEYVGLSRSQLHRRMKEIVGVAPSDYIRNVKLRMACEMLSAGDVDIAQVAYSLGFSAQSHFSTLFKRYTGMTPTEYRIAVKDGKITGVSDNNGNES